jgi:hypothetical protein
MVGFKCIIKTLRHWGAPVKLLTEYLERAVQLENLAAGETDLHFKDQLLNQAAVYQQQSEPGNVGSRLQVRPKQTDCRAPRLWLAWCSRLTVAVHPNRWHAHLDAHADPTRRHYETAPPRCDDCDMLGVSKAAVSPWHGRQTARVYQCAYCAKVIWDD